MNEDATRKIAVEDNRDHNAQFNGHTVRVTLYHNPNQLSSMNITREEAEQMAAALDHYLTENPA